MAEGTSILYITFISVIVFATREINNANAEISKSCAVLYKGHDLKGYNFSLLDGSHVTNFEDEYISSSDVWNTTLSFSVEKGCLFTACNESHFNGDCQKFQSSLNKLPDGFDNFLSANCTCPKVCSCSDIYMRKRSCARAYFGEGCDVCNRYYTDLNKRSEKDFFESFSDKIAAITVRQGCQLTIYNSTSFEGTKTHFSKPDQTWKGVIGSYECICAPDSFTSKPKPPRPENYPALIDIPSTIDNVTSMMTGDLEKHPGLLAALSSLRNGRSSKNVYILTVGTTGAGKSSVVNLLFDNPNVTLVGGEESTTKDIHEFRIPIPVDKLGIANSELRIIDTPGLGDTKGIPEDAKFLATLDEYLQNHEELHNRIPNVVLILHRFDDNRYAGIKSVFVKMLRGLDEFRTRITDENYSNVIFVLSHFMSATKGVRKNPKETLAKFKNVIQDYSQFPKPVVIAVAENKGEDQGLPMVNGYFKLPNGDFYPRNLFDKIQLATSRGGDLIGDAVIRTGFRDADDFNITSHTFRLVDSSNKKIPKYLGILTMATDNVNKTEISKLLAETYEKLDYPLKQKFPYILLYLQTALNVRNIRTKADIPKTTLDILKLILSIKQNKATLYLLENALQLKPPLFPQNVVAGYSYNVFKDMPLAKSPYKLGDLETSDIGYLFPSTMKCEVENAVENFVKIKENLAEYIEERKASLGIQGTISKENFKALVKPGFNIKDQAFQNDSCKITAVKEIRTFELVLNDKPELTLEFKQILENLPAFNESDHENVKIWTDLFAEYGTHVVQHVYGGGAIELELKSNRACDPDIVNTILNLIQFAEDLTVINSNSSTNLIGDEIQHRLTFKGGDQTYHTTDLTKMTLEQASSLLKSWKSSLRLNPVILTTEMRLLPLSEVAKQVREKQNISSEIQRATSLLFNSSLKYNPKANTVPSDRQETGEGPSQNSLNALMKTLEMFQKDMIKMQEERAAENLRWHQRYENQSLKAEADRIEMEKKNKRELASIQEVMNKQHKDLIDKLTKTTTPKPETTTKSGSCLKNGTPILLANGSEKHVEYVRVGDILLDHKLNPTRVIGVSKLFLMDQRFYGFDNKSFFFTEVHTFAGPYLASTKSSEASELQFYVKDREALIGVNPLFEYIGVEEMSQSKEFMLYKFDQTVSNVISKNVKVFKDPVTHPKDTMVNFIQVDSPHSTYFANGFVCRHEIPPFEHWSNTMAILLSLHSNPDFMVFENVPYTLESLPIIYQILDEIEFKVRETLRSLSVKDLNMEEPPIDLSSEDADLIIGSVFNHPSSSAFGIGLYSRVGKIMSLYLDDVNSHDLIAKPYVGSLQRLLLHVISKQVSDSVQTYLK